MIHDYQKNLYEVEQMQVWSVDMFVTIDLLFSLDN